MVAVPLPAAELEALLEALGSDAALAADNGPRACVASGSDGALDALAGALDTRGVRAVRLPGRYPFSLRGRRWRGGRPARRARRPAVPRAFADAALVGDGRRDAAVRRRPTGRPTRRGPCACGPHCDRSSRTAIRCSSSSARILSCAVGWRRPRAGRSSRRCGAGATARAGIAELVGAVYAEGADVDWTTWTGGRPQNVTLPPQDWRDERAWLEGMRPGDQGPAADGAMPSGPLTLVDAEVEQAVGTLTLDGAGEVAGGARPPEATEAAGGARPPAAGEPPARRARPSARQRRVAAPAPEPARGAVAPEPERTPDAVAPEPERTRDVAAIVQDAVRFAAGPPAGPSPCRRSAACSTPDWTRSPPSSLPRTCRARSVATCRGRLTSSIRRRHGSRRRSRRSRRARPRRVRSRRARRRRVRPCRARPCRVRPRRARPRRGL